MNKRQYLSRRQFLRLGLGTAAAAAGSGILGRDALLRQQEQIARASRPPLPLRYFLAGTDGWISMPTDTPASTYFPDAAAADVDPNDPSKGQFTTYVFGFANLASYLPANATASSPTPANTSAMKNHAQAPGPLMYFDEGQEYAVRLTNLGLAQRPDLVDSHTIHWHGFRNAIPMFDGEPTSSVSVPIGRVLDYYYKPREAGTYMYHCHFEDTEHVHMGMTGALFVRPAQNGNTSFYPSGKYTYSDNNGSTAYDREFVMFMSEVWAEQHWDDAHIQLPEWTDYRPDFCLLNGRCYPDTLLPAIPSTTIDQLRLARQPMSALVTANAGERILLRFSNLGYTYQSMTIPGLKMKVIGKDATLLRGRDGTDTSYYTNTISIGPGESYEAIITAPNVTTQTTYLLYNRNYSRLNNAGSAGFGGQMTEIRISPAGTLPPQTEPNT